MLFPAGEGNSFYGSSPLSQLSLTALPEGEPFGGFDRAALAPPSSKAPPLGELPRKRVRGSSRTIAPHLPSDTRRSPHNPFNVRFYVLPLFTFVENGKFSSKNHKSAAGKPCAAAKYIITSRGEKGAASRTCDPPSRAIKACSPAIWFRKGVMPVAHQEERKL